MCKLALGYHKHESQRNSLALSRRDTTSIKWMSTLWLEFGSSFWLELCDGVSVKHRQHKGSSVSTERGYLLIFSGKVCQHVNRLRRQVSTTVDEKSFDKYLVPTLNQKCSDALVFCTSLCRRGPRSFFLVLKCQFHICSGISREYGSTAREKNS